MNLNTYLTEQQYSVVFVSSLFHCVFDLGFGVLTLHTHSLHLSYGWISCRFFSSSFVVVISRSWRKHSEFCLLVFVLTPIHLSFICCINIYKYSLISRMEYFPLLFYYCYFSLKLFKHVVYINLITLRQILLWIWKWS